MVVPYLRILKGGRYQQPVNPYATGWWRRIQIAQAIEPGRTESEAENADLQFLVLTDRARAEETLRFTQRNLIDQFIDAAIHTPGYNADVASALFELLLPTSLKDMARDETDLVLVLDRAAAQYPWELLAERTRKGLQPLAKRTKVIRQFKTSNYRASPQAPRGQNALVIGDPVSKQVELPGAASSFLQHTFPSCPSFVHFPSLQHSPSDPVVRAGILPSLLPTSVLSYLQQPCSLL
jgi:hypothetical protein